MNDRIWRMPKGWTTPARDYPLKRVAKVAIKRMTYEPGVFEMYGVRGAKYWKATTSVPVTYLEINGKTWMVDDPPHWEGVCEFAHRVRPGKVLIAGLGLGLIVWALQVRKDVGPITLVERNFDVIKLMKPLLPKCNIEIVHDDFWHFCGKLPKAPDYQTAIIDLWVGHGPTLYDTEVNRYVELFDFMFPSMLSLWFGFQGHIDTLRKMKTDAMALLSDPKVQQQLERLKSDTWRSSP